MSTEKDNELENENFEDAFGISDDFDEDEFDIDEADLEDDDILAGFPEPGGSSDNAFGSDLEDDFADVEDEYEDVSAEYDDFEEDNAFSEESDFEEDNDFVDEDIEDDEFADNDFDDSDLEESEEEDFADEDLESDSDVTPGKSNKIAKMAFYLGTVAILGGIGFVGVNTFMPNLLGGSSPAPVSAPAPKPVMNTTPPVPSSNSGIIVGNTPPAPSPVNQSIEIQKPNQSNAPELVNIRPNLSGMGNDVQAPNDSMSIGQVTSNDSVIPNNNQVPINNNVNQADNKSVTMLETKIDNEITEISASISDIKAMFVETMNSIGSLEKNFVTKQDLDGSVRTIVSSLIPKMNQNNSNLEFENIISDLKTEIEMLNSKIDNQSSNSNPVQIIDNSSEIESLTQELSLMREEVVSLRNQLASSKDTVSTLEAVIEKQNKELSETKKSVARVRSEAKKRQDAANAIGGGIVPPSKPSVISNYRLAGVSRNTAWVESSSGTVRVNVGQTIPGLGLIEAIVPADGNWSLVTESGIIIP